MIANSTFYICFRNKASGSGAGTNKAIEKLGSPRCLDSRFPGDHLSLLSNCSKLILFAFLEWKWSTKTGANKRCPGDTFDSGGIRFQFKCAAANLTTLTLHNNAGGSRPRGLGSCGRCGLGSAALSGSPLSKWNESCQLSKSARCPPQAWAYQAHLSLSCLCLLISMCIFLSLSPKGGILGTVPNANYGLTL